MRQAQSDVARIAMGSFLIDLSLTGQAALAPAQAYPDYPVRLLSLVAHDLKSPLNAILGIGEFLQDYIKTAGAHPAPEEILEHLGIMLHMGQDMVHLIEGLLHSAHLESGKLVLEPLPVDDLAGALQGTCDAFQDLAARGGITLRTELGDALPGVYWDIARIQYHVLHNLLANAVKYTGAGGTVVLRGYAGKTGVCIDVADNGPGISPEDRNKVFDRFERLGLTSERVYQGSGLGLYNAHLLVGQHGGSIAVEEGLDGRGVTFRVELPAYPPVFGRP